MECLRGNMKFKKKNVNGGLQYSKLVVKETFYNINK